MKDKGRVTIVALAAFVWLLAIAAVGCGGSSTVTSGNTTGSSSSGGMMYGNTAGTTGTMMGSSTSVSMMGGGTTGSMMGGGSGSSVTGGSRVVLKDLAFNPASVTIAVGATVTWENQDSMNHNVIADDGSFKSPDLGSGETFSFTFQKAGTYTYSCHIHPNMKGTVVVR
jgi:plastocyanin